LEREKHLEERRKQLRDKEQERAGGEKNNNEMRE
jgi:hypothetical protein